MNPGPIYSHLRSLTLATFPSECVSRYGQTIHLKKWLNSGAYTVKQTTKTDALLVASTFDLGEALLVEIEHLQNHCFEHLQELVAGREDTRDRSSAWAVVTAYYFSFFAALAFSRITGQTILYGTREVSHQFQKLAGSTQSIVPGPWNLMKVADISITEANYQIVHTKKRFHEAVWHNVLGSISALLKDKSLTTDPREVLFYQLLATQTLFSRYTNYEWPSAIRNLTNYQPGLGYRMLLGDDPCQGTSLLDPWIDATDDNAVVVLDRLDRLCSNQNATFGNDTALMLAVGIGLFRIVRALYAELLNRKKIDKRWESGRARFRKRMLPETERFELFAKIF